MEPPIGAANDSSFIKTQQKGHPSSAADPAERIPVDERSRRDGRPGRMPDPVFVRLPSFATDATSGGGSGVGTSAVGASAGTDPSTAAAVHDLHANMEAALAGIDPRFLPFGGTSEVTTQTGDNKGTVITQGGCSISSRPRKAVNQRRKSSNIKCRL
mmetsp:Transcript_11866/g.24707  ORF Transcript_11866/g.24707 Transcript_11866/m.24707 type:complete len:157 (-) Transcript_11866:62-532(-)